MLNKTTNLFIMLAAFVLVLGLTIPGGIEVYAHHKEGHGGGGDDTATNDKLGRAVFREEHKDRSITAIQSDISDIPGMGNLRAFQCVVDDEGAYDYWDPGDTVCNPPGSGVPQVGSNIINNQGNWDMWMPPAGLAADNANAPEGEKVVIKRWTAFDFTDLIGVNLNCQGEIKEVPVDGCLDLDKLLYNDDKYGGPSGEGLVVFDPDTGGLDVLPCQDNLVIHLRTDFTVSLFDLPDEALVDVELRIMAPTDPPVKKGAEEGDRWWEPRFRIDHGQWQKTTPDPINKPDVIVLHSIRQPCDANDPSGPKCHHLADLIDLIASGPLSRRIVATYDMPVEIEITRIP